MIRALLPALVALPLSAGAEPVATLPLQTGYYVDSAVPCAEASNATLLLVLPSGINAAQVECTISAIDRTGPTTFSVTDSCVELASGSDFGTTTTVYDIPDDRSFAYVDGTTTVFPKRFCAQTDLPEPWRSNAIGD